MCLRNFAKICHLVWVVSFHFPDMQNNNFENNCKACAHLNKESITAALLQSSTNCVAIQMFDYIQYLAYKWRQVFSDISPSCNVLLKRMKFFALA